MRLQAGNPTPSHIAWRSLGPVARRPFRSQLRIPSPASDHIRAWSPCRPNRMAVRCVIRRGLQGPCEGACALIVTRAVTADMKVRLGAIRPSPPSEVLDRVEAIWEAEKAKRPKALFNGSLFSIDDMGATEI